MTSKQKNILAISVTSVIIIVLFVLALISSYIPLNDENTVGNTPGNLIITAISASMTDVFISRMHTTITHFTR